MRNTVHLVTAADCLALRPLIQPVMDRDLRGNTTYTPKIAGLDLTELAAAGRSAVEDEPRVVGLDLLPFADDHDPVVGDSEALTVAFQVDADLGTFRTMTFLSRIARRTTAC